MIREATQDDTEALSRLAMQTYSDAFGHSMSASDLAAHLQNHLTPNHIDRMLGEDTVLVAETHNHIVGFVQFGPSRDHTAPVSTTAQEVRRLYVHRDFQNQRIGTGLMEAALAHPRLRNIEHIFLDVWVENAGARRFYERFGFQVIGERHFTVESGAETSPDLIMVRNATEIVTPKP